MEPTTMETITNETLRAILDTTKLHQGMRMCICLILQHTYIQPVWIVGFTADDYAFRVYDKTGSYLSYRAGEVAQWIDNKDKACIQTLVARYNQRAHTRWFDIDGARVQYANITVVNRKEAYESIVVDIESTIVRV